jgi:hypothetical protein
LISSLIALAKSRIHSRDLGMMVSRAVADWYTNGQPIGNLRQLRGIGATVARHIFRRRVIFHRAPPRTAVHIRDWG